MYSYVLLFAGLLSASSAASLKEGDSDKFIVGGDEVEKVGKYPWQCGLQWNAQHTCGCAVIDEKWVVTAAHCLWQNSSTGYRVLVGAHDHEGLIHGRPTFHYVYNYTIHPDFEMNSAKGFPNDIGVVELSSSIDMSSSYVKAIQMYDGPEDFANDKCIISGWGLTDGGVNDNPNNLQYARVEVYSNDYCKTFYSSIFDGHVCSGVYAEKGACNGDSGGPLVCNHFGEFVLVGLTSFGRFGCDTKAPSAYARMSHYRSWVKSVTGV